MIPARKRWGQHFLARAQKRRERIVEAAARSVPRTTVARGRPRRRRPDPPLAAQRGTRASPSRSTRCEAEALEREFAGDPRVRIVPRRRSGAPVCRSWLGEAGCERPGRSSSRTCPTTSRRRSSSPRSESRRRSRRVVVDRAARGGPAFRRAPPGQESYGYLSVRAAALATGEDPLRSPAGRLPAAAEGDVDRARAVAAAPPLEPGLARSRAAPGVARLSTPAARRSPTRSPPRAPRATGSARSSPRQVAARPRRGALARGLPRARRGAGGAA